MNLVGVDTSHQLLHSPSRPMYNTMENRSILRKAACSRSWTERVWMEAIQQFDAICRPRPTNDGQPISHRACFRSAKAMVRPDAFFVAGDRFFDSGPGAERGQMSWIFAGLMLASKHLG